MRERSFPDFACAHPGYGLILALAGALPLIAGREVAPHAPALQHRLDLLGHEEARAVLVVVLESWSRSES
jgi:hypothetical protein